MEIERKWRMDRAPLLPYRCRLRVEQSYLSLTPEVRVRRYEDLDQAGSCRYDLTIKSEGDLAREEIIKELTEEEYRILAEMAGGAPIVKQYANYALGDYVLEFSLVDPGRPECFSYAEVEFPTREEAEAFQPPDWFGAEMTYQSAYKMKNYWRDTRLKGGAE
jgi:CYTH domain-containing protein